VRALRDTDRDVAAVAAVALGALRSVDGASALAAIAAEAKADEFVRAHAVAALARTGSPGAEAALRVALGDSSIHVARSAALGLAAIAPPLEAATEALLRDTIERGRDVQAKNWALLAIGRAGAPASREFLLSSIDRHQRSTKSSCALALALQSRRQPLDAKALAFLRTCLDETRDPSVGSALALSLSLASDRDAIPRLREIVRSAVTPSFRGAAAEALSLLADSAFAPDLLRLLGDGSARRDADFLRSVRRALARLSCRDATALLVLDVERAHLDPEAAASAASALGTLGDPAALPRLVLLAGGAEGGSSAAVRAHAIVAMGFLLADDPGALRRAFAEGLNYRAMVPALNALLDIL
jgi:HEAT repeat protein